MTDVEAVLFDLDLTLVYMNIDVRDQLVAKVCRELAARHGLDEIALVTLQAAVTLTRWRELQDTLLASPADAPDGMTIMRSIWSDALASCGCDDVAVVDEAFMAYWENRAGVFSPFEEVLDALSARLPLAVITNGPSVTQLDKLEVLGLDSYFDVFVASGDAGCEKPAPPIFEFALQKLGVRPEAAWHIGDNLQADIAGALGAGIRAVWLNRDGEVRGPDDPQPDAEISNLRELLALLPL